MATYSSILAWEIPWTEEPGGLQSEGSPRVRHDGATEQQQGNNPRLFPGFVTLRPLAFKSCPKATEGSEEGCRPWGSPRCFQSPVISY